MSGKYIDEDCLHITDPKAVAKFYEILNRGCIHPIEKSPFNKSEAEKQAFLRRLVKNKMMENAKIIKSIDVGNGIIADFLNDGTVTFTDEFSHDRNTPNMVVEDVDIGMLKKAIEEFELVEK